MQEWPKKLYKKVSTPFVEICVLNRISSNQITLINHFMTLTFGCYFFSLGVYWAGLAGLGICLVNGFLDYLDGDVARANNKLGQLGVWLDSGFDVIVQNAVMGAIAIGCHVNGLSIIWVVLFFVGNAANNFVSFNYNAKFGFDSDKGNELFRLLMDRKCHPFNRIIKNIIDPTSNYLSLSFYTYRYWIALGAIFNIMPFCFMAMTLISNFKWVVMYLIYSFYLSGEDRLFVFKALSALDEEKDDFYQLRHSQEV